MLRTDKYEERAYNQDYEHFLVITIDDLDLNTDVGFEMLELIHRYMMVPQADKIFVENKKDIDRLSRDFINKILLFNTRIYMSSVKYWAAAGNESESDIL